MSEAVWNAVDSYLDQLFIGDDAVLRETLRASVAAGLPPIQVSPTQGKLLDQMVRMCGARRVLEIGTLGGYSAIWMARGLPADGKLISLEVDARNAAVARANMEHAGLAAKVEIHLGAALDLLPTIATQGGGPFDLTFIDADKVNSPAYFEWALRLSRVGSVIIVDNVVREGNVLHRASDDPAILGTRRVLETMAAEPRVTATAIQTVGCKGYDGFAIALVTS